MTPQALSSGSGASRARGRVASMEDRCRLAQALEILGDRWALLILRSAFSGSEHFEEFQRELGIARNILSSRLGALVAIGVLDRRTGAGDRRKVVYSLTGKGDDLLPAVVALCLWSERWSVGASGQPRPVDRRTGEPIVATTLLRSDGLAVDPRDVAWSAAAREPPGVSTGSGDDASVCCEPVGS